MKQKRKFLQMLDVRVRQSLSGHTLTSTGRLTRVHSIESLASAHTETATLHAMDKLTETARA